MSTDCRGWRNRLAPDARGVFPPGLVAQVKAWACELPAQLGVPLSRWSMVELTQHLLESGLVAQVSASTVWRWLHEDAIRPWFHRCWIFPRDPDFAAKAGRLLDLYQRRWQGQPLRADEFVISADEKTSIQARQRIHPTAAPAPGMPMKVEHEYERRGSIAYIAAWDVHRARVFGRCEDNTGIVAFDQLVDQVMSQSPYRQARRVFWIVDYGSSHRGSRSVKRLQDRHPNLRLIHGPVHASWLNQIEIYFSIIQRKVLTPNDYPSTAAVIDALHRFERHYENHATPFKWKFTRADLNRLLRKLRLPSTEPLALAA